MIINAVFDQENILREWEVSGFNFILDDFILENNWVDVFIYVGF